MNGLAEADAKIADAAVEFGFDDSKTFLAWMDLETPRRANLVLRAAQSRGKLGNGAGKILDRLSGLVGRFAALSTLRLSRAHFSRACVLDDIAVAHVSSSPVAASGNATNPTVEDSAPDPDFTPFPGSGALSGGDQ